MTTPDGKTPAAPDNDTTGDSAHAGESEQQASGRTPETASQAEGEDTAGQ